MATTTPLSPTEVARMIAENTAAHLDGRLDRATWSTEQVRLWDLVAREDVPTVVRALGL